MAIREISLSKKTGFTNRVVMSGILKESDFTRDKDCYSVLDNGFCQVTLKWRKKYSNFKKFLGKYVMVEGMIVSTRHLNRQKNKYLKSLAIRVCYMEEIYDL